MARPAGSIFESGTAVLFDLDNTLIDRDRARDRFFSFMLDSCFPHLQPEGAAWTDRMEMLRALDNGGRGSKAAIYDHSFSDIPGLSPESFTELMRVKLASYASWSDGAVLLLKCLRARRHPMALVTNGSKSQRTKIDAIGALEYFDAVLISEEVGIAKPDPAIFTQAMSRLNAAPDRSVFVGDSLEHDMAGARDAGMMTVYLNRSGASVVDESLCDLVVSDLRELADRVIGLES